MKIRKISLLTVTTISSLAFLSGSNHASADGAGGQTAKLLQTKESSASAKDVRYIEYPPQGVLLGQGWDSFTGKAAPQKCIRFSEHQIPGHDLQVRTQTISNRYELNKALKLSMSASYSGFGMKANAKANYSRSLDIDQNKTNILATIDVWKGDLFVGPSYVVDSLEESENPVTTVVQQESSSGGLFGRRTAQPNQDPKVVKGDYLSVALTTDALDYLNAKKFDEFRKLCGDSYVSHIRNGASLNAYLTYEGTSQESKERLAATISANGWGAKFQGSIDKSKRVKTVNDNTLVRIFQSGGYMSPSPLTIEQFNQTVRDFTKSPDPKSFPVKPFQVGLLSYANLIVPEGTSIPNPDSMLELYTLYWLFDDLRKDYIKAVTDPEFYHLYSVRLNDIYNKDDKINLRIDRSLSCTYSFKKEENTPNEWLPEENNAPACPSGKKLDQSLPFEKEQVLGRLEQISLIQQSLKRAIQDCRNRNVDSTDTKADRSGHCYSTQAFEDETARIKQKFTADNFNVDPEVIKAARSVNPRDFMAALEFMQENDDVVSIGPSSLENIQRTKTELAAFSDSFSKRPDESVTTMRAFADQNEQEELYSMGEQAVAKFLGDFGGEYTVETAALIKTKIASLEQAMKPFSTDLTADDFVKAKFISELETYNTLDVWPLNTILTRSGLAKSDYYNYLSNDAPVLTASLEEQNLLQIQNEWGKLALAYYHFLALLPIQTHDYVAEGGVSVRDRYKTTPNASATVLEANERAFYLNLREDKYDQLASVAKSFCNEDVLDPLCLTTNQIVSVLDSSNLHVLNMRKAEPEEYGWRTNFYCAINRGNRRHPKVIKKCRYVSRPMHYFNDIVAGIGADL